MMCIYHLSNIHYFPFAYIICCGFSRVSMLQLFLPLWIAPTYVYIDRVSPTRTVWIQRPANIKLYLVECMQVFIILLRFDSKYSTLIVYTMVRMSYVHGMSGINHSYIEFYFIDLFCNLFLIQASYTNNMTNTTPSPSSLNSTILINILCCATTRSN